MSIEMMNSPGEFMNLEKGWDPLVAWHKNTVIMDIFPLPLTPTLSNINVVL